MGLCHRPAAAPWTRRRAQALCCTLGRPPASAVNPSSTAQTATMTCHPRPCPGTHRSPARREHPLIPPASSSRPGPTTSCHSQQGEGVTAQAPRPVLSVKGKQPPAPYQRLNPFSACLPCDHPHCLCPPVSHIEPLFQAQPLPCPLAAGALPYLSLCLQKEGVAPS